MHRWAPLNGRQRALLSRIAAGEELQNQASDQRRSAYALRDRGLLVVKRRQGVLLGEVTGAGKFYLKHGHHPEDPAYAEEGPKGTVPGDPPAPADTKNVAKLTTSAKNRPRAAKKAVKKPTPYSERPIPLARQAKARELIEQLTAGPHVTISSPSEEEVTEWRRVIDFAKRHGLVPEGKRIERLRLYNRGRDLQISLLDGPHPNAGRQPPGDALPVLVPAQLHTPHPVVAGLRDDTGRLVMPKAPRRRALLLFQGLATEAVRRGHRVQEHPVSDRHRSRAYSYNGQYFPAGYTRREGEMNLAVGGFAYTVTIEQESPRAEDPERAAKLVIKLGYSRSDRRGQWADRKRWQLEDVLGFVLQEIETRAVEDAQRQAEEVRARAERKVRWQEAMHEAKQQAAEAQLASVLTEQARTWGKHPPSANTVTRWSGVWTRQKPRGSPRCSPPGNGCPGHTNTSSRSIH